MGMIEIRKNTSIDVQIAKCCSHIPWQCHLWQHTEHRHCLNEESGPPGAPPELRVMPREVLRPLLSGCVTRRVISDAAFDAFHQVSLQRFRDDRMRVDFAYEPGAGVTLAMPHWG